MPRIYDNIEIDNQTAIRLKKSLAEECREQRTIGMPTNADEIGLRRLARQIKERKAEIDVQSRRKFLTFSDGTRSYFPIRKPITVKFKIDETNPSDQYARRFGKNVVNAVKSLRLPWYGLKKKLLTVFMNSRLVTRWMLTISDRQKKSLVTG